MATTFRMDVERFKAELLKQVQPGTETIDLHLNTNFVSTSTISVKRLYSQDLMLFYFYQFYKRIPFHLSGQKWC